MINKIRAILKRFNALVSPKIFCISMQRTGTTSVGQFFKEHNYKVATWDISRKNSWTVDWFKGDYERIFGSSDFKLNQVFEDDPWFCLDFYKVLFHRFPKAKFVLIERDADQWFDSMVKHSNGRTLGNTHRHAVIYQRLEEYNQLELEKGSKFNSIIDNLMPLNESHREHYTTIYKLRNLEVKSFFEYFGKERLVVVQLEDKSKWQKIGNFSNIKVDAKYEVHANKSE